MAARKATDVELVTVASSSVRFDYDHGILELDREECFPRGYVTWLGDRLWVELATDRYRSSSGMGGWRRPYVTRAHHVNDAGEHGPSFSPSDTARSAIADAFEPVVMAWLESDAYRQSRRIAFASAISYEVDKTSVYNNRAGDLLARFEDELGEKDRDRLVRATAARLESEELRRGPWEGC